MPNIIWTNHLEERLRQRGISHNEAFSAIRHPDKSVKLAPNKWKHFKAYGQKQVVIIAVYEDKQWIVLSAWVKSPSSWPYKKLAGENFVQKLVRRLLINLVSTIKNWLS